MLVSPGVQLDENLQLMQAGSMMRKVKSRSWKKQRYFKLQEDCMTIWYKSKKTGNTKSTCELSEINTGSKKQQKTIVLYVQSLRTKFTNDAGLNNGQCRKC